MKPFAILAGASLMALAGASAVAQTAPTAPAPDQQAQTRRSDAEALLDARLAGVRAGLKLNPEQERLFAPVEQAYRTMAAERARRFEERRGDRGRQDDREQLDMMQRLDRQAERATQNSQRIAAFAAAMRPFWASLDENQKRLLPRLLRAGHEGRRGGMMRHHREHRMDGDRMERRGGMERGGRMDRDHHRTGGDTQRL